MGVVRGEATRDAPVPVPGRPVRDGLQVISFRPTSVRDAITFATFPSMFEIQFLNYYTCILTLKFHVLTVRNLNSLMTLESIKCHN